MPKKEPPVETRWKKGKSGNPSGRPKEDPKIKAFKQTSYQEFVKALQKYGTMTAAELKEDLKRPDATMFELLFGGIVSAAAKGDSNARQLLIDRLWGKVKDGVDLNINQVEVTPENVAKLYEIARRA